jgi:hypothetical protein
MTLAPRRHDSAWRGAYPASLAHVGRASGSGGGSDGRLGTSCYFQPFEPMPGNAGVMRRVLGISVAEVILHRSAR